MKLICIYRKTPSHWKPSLKGHPGHFPRVSDGGKLGVGKLRAEMGKREGREQREGSTWILSSLNLLPASLSKECTVARCGWGV